MSFRPNGTVPLPFPQQRNRSKIAPEHKKKEASKKPASRFPDIQLFHLQIKIARSSVAESKLGFGLRELSLGASGSTDKSRFAARPSA
jgi:hypothetical protein